MTTPITFAVLGVPAPQGSKTPVMRGGKPALIEGGSSAGRSKHKAWREAVAWQARAAAPDKPLDGPLKLVVAFRMPMPASRPAADRKRGHLWHSVKPDIDKLIRSTLDGIADGGVIVGDSRIAGVQASAIEVDSWTGAVIQVVSLRDIDATASRVASEDIAEQIGAP